MDINQLDAQSVAGAVGHMAAARLYALLRGYAGTVHNWYSAGTEHTDEDIEAHVELLAGFVCARSYVTADALRQFALIERIPGAPGNADWQKSYAMRAAYELFVSSCRQAFSLLSLEQNRLDELDRTANLKPGPKLKREDSIAELVDGPDDEVEWAEDYRRRERENAQRNKSADAAAPVGDKKSPNDPKAGGSVTQPTDQAEGRAPGQAALSAGETLAKSPTRKGGRPRAGAGRKPARSTKR